MTRTVPLDKRRELLYKSFELYPLAKLSVEAGAEVTISVLNSMEYLRNLGIPRDLTWIGHNRTVTPMDVATIQYVRDHPVFSQIKRKINIGTAKQFGTNVPEESKIGAGSAIALVQETEEGNIEYTRKKEIGLDDKHAEELIKVFYDVETESEPEHAEKKILKEEKTPVLKKEVIPLLKRDKKIVVKDGKTKRYKLPWS